VAKTILIVEDNFINRTMFRDVLQASGYETIESVDGKDTLQLAREHQPDLILMDVQLPEGDGLEYTKMLKADEALKHIPVIVVTATLPEKEKEIRESGCDGYLAKPITIPTFLETVAKHIK